MKKRILALFMAVLVLFTFNTGNVMAITNSTDTTITVCSAEGKNGDEISIDILIDNNPGLWGMDIKISYDRSALTLVSVTNGTFFQNSEWTKGNLNSDIYVLSYEANSFEDITTVSGVLATLNFVINDSTPAGEYAICASYNVGDIINIDFDDLIFATVNGAITVKGTHTHSFTEKVKNDDTRKSAATCEFDAVYYYSCECGEISTTETFVDVGSKMSHRGGTATCSKKAICDNCGNEYGEFDHNNHVNTTVINSKNATCTVPGYTGDTYCNDCKNIIEYGENIPATDHKWDNGTVTAPTCLTEGYTTYTCTVDGCGATKTENSVPATGHKGGTATCVSQAICDTCKTAYGELDPNNHENIVTDEAVPATCTATGLTEGSRCDACNIVIKVQEETKMLPHTPVSAENGKAATCLEDGKEADTICSVCKKTLEEGKVLPSTGHKGGTATCVSKAICDTCKTAYGELNPDNHEKVVTDEAVSATCTTTGLTEGSHCDACGTTIVEQEEIKMLPHTPVSANNGKAATCLEDGKEADTICSVCKTKLADGKVLSKTGHTGGTATCVSKAICDTCKTAYGELNPDNHEKVVTDEAVPATCTSTGLTEGSHCDACGTTIVEQEETNKLPHTPVSANNGKAATCLEDGKEADTICSVCKTKLADGKVLSKTGHKGGTATCASKAVCDTCKTAYGELDPNNHEKVVTDEAVPATCTSTGLTEGSHCDACGTTIVEQEETNKLPHTPVSANNGKAATCLEDGKEADTICSVCKTKLADGKVLPKTGHKGGTATCVSKAVCDTCKTAYGELDPTNHENIVTDEAVPATCTETGLTEGSHCDACGRTIVAQEETDKLPHTEVTVGAKEATCKEEGYTGDVICSVCNINLSTGTVIEKIPHTPVSANNGKAATCLEDGKEADTICSVCKKTLEEGKVLPKIGHTGGTATCVSKAICDTCKTAYGELDPNNHENVVTDGAVPATCTSTGLTEGSHCDACGTTIVEQKKTDMLPHTEKTVNAKEATCKEEGYTGDVICSVCNTNLSTGTTIDKLPHTEKTVGAKEATCKEEGYTGDVICSVCGETISTGTIIDKLAHTPISADNAVPATCETEGKESDIICDACGDTLETGKTIPALEHKWSVVSTKEATCLVDGAIEYVCDNDASHTKTEVIKAQGHKDDDANDICDVCGQQLGECKHTSASVINVKEATCTETGYSGDIVCDICGETIELGHETDIIEHTVVIDIAVAATCTNDGLTEGSHCSACGTVIVKQTIVVATGHSYGKWQTVEKPTCSTNGLDVRACTVCGYEQSEIIPMTGFVDDDEDGLCDECGVSKEEHPTDGFANIIFSAKKIILIILGILEAVFTALDAASVGNGPYKELLAVVKELQKSFGFIS